MRFLLAMRVDQFNAETQRRQENNFGAIRRLRRWTQILTEQLGEMGSAFLLKLWRERAVGLMWLRMASKWVRNGFARLKNGFVMGSF